jgi:hypothetical protein
MPLSVCDYTLTGASTRSLLHAGASGEFPKEFGILQTMGDFLQIFVDEIQIDTLTEGAYGAP